MISGKSSRALPPTSWRCTPFSTSAAIEQAERRPARRRVQVEAALCAEFGEALFKLGNAATIRIAQKIPEAGLGTMIMSIFARFYLRVGDFARCVRGVGNFDEGDSDALGPWRRSGRGRSRRHDRNTASFIARLPFRKTPTSHPTSTTRDAAGAGATSIGIARRSQYVRALGRPRRRPRPRRQRPRWRRRPARWRWVRRRLRRRLQRPWRRRRRPRRLRRRPRGFRDDRGGGRDRGGFNDRRDDRRGGGYNDRDGDRRGGGGGRPGSRGRARWAATSRRSRSRSASSSR